MKQFAHPALKGKKICDSFIFLKVHPEQFKESYSELKAREMFYAWLVSESFFFIKTKTSVATSLHEGIWEKQHLIANNSVCFIA